MGLKLNKELTTQSGLSIPVNNIVVSAIHFPTVKVGKDAEGNKTYTRIITYDLFNYATEAMARDLGDDYIKGGCIEFGGGYEKRMTDAEYAAILADGSISEVWLKEYIDDIMGAGTCAIIDPYV